MRIRRMYGLKNRSPAVDKYRVTLDADERATLERLVAVGKGAARRLTSGAVRGPRAGAVNPSGSWFLTRKG